MQTYLKTKPVWVQLLLFLGMSFGLFMILVLIGGMVLTSITGVSMLEGAKNLDPNNAGMKTFFRGMLLLQFLGLFLIPSLLFAFFSDPKPAAYLGLKKPSSSIYWILGIAAMIIAIPAVEYSGLLNQKMNLGPQMKSLEEQAGKQIQFMLSKHTPAELILNLVFISLFAGIGEEFFFRGILQRMFIRAFKNPWAGIIVTAILFSAFHLQFFGFVPRLLLGIVLGAIYWYSGSLWAAVLAHFFYDAFFIVMAYIKPSMVQDPGQNVFNPVQLIPLALVSTFLTLGLLWYMKKRSVNSYEAVYENDVVEKNPFTF